MIKRKNYLEKLIAWKDEKVIKVVTGIRRCGKSTLLDLYKEYLKKSGTGRSLQSILRILNTRRCKIIKRCMRICQADCATVK